MPESSTRSVYYPDPTRGWGPYAPPRSLVPDAPGPIWRNINNLLPQDGLLQRRGGIVASSGIGSPSEDLPALTETVVWMEGFEYPTDGNAAFVATNRQLYLNRGASWTNVTPTYTAGTLAATNGSGTIVGSGTAWLTRKITAGQMIQIDGTWYSLATVTGDTAATITPNFSGATGAGKAYTIRRSFKGGSILGIEAQIFAVVQNQNWYIGGTYLGSANGTVSPAVIKVSDVLSGSPIVEYLTAKFDLTGSLDEISALNSISGIRALQDGRVVILGNDGTIFYPSLLDDTVWTITPGGNTPLTQKAGPAYALGNLGNSLTIHYAEGIVFGYPTGQTDPPLRFEESQATHGCVSPRTLAVTPRGEQYTGWDGSSYVFDGASSVDVGFDIRPLLEGMTQSEKIIFLHAAYDHKRKRYMLFHCSDSTGDRVTKSWSQDLDGSWWPCQFAMMIGSVLGRDPSGIGTWLVGCANYDGSSERDLVSVYRESQTLDSIVFSNTSSGVGSIFVETDDLDLGLPFHNKTPIRLILAIRHANGGSGGTESIRASASVTGGTTFVNASDVTVTHVAAGESIIQFSFADLLEASPIVRFKLAPASPGGSFTFDAAIVRLLVELQLGSEMIYVSL